MRAYLHAPGFRPQPLGQMWGQRVYETTKDERISHDTVFPSPCGCPPNLPSYGNSSYENLFSGVNRTMKTSTGLSSGLRKAGQLLGLIFASLLLCVPMFSQGSSGRIVGTITDANGGAIAGATVTVLDVARGTSRTLSTDESGVYSAPNLIPGAYSVRAEFKGFKAIERKNITLEVAQELRGCL